jgi:hypothetical protein
MASASVVESAAFMDVFGRRVLASRSGLDGARVLARRVTQMLITRLSVSGVAGRRIMD